MSVSLKWDGLTSFQNALRNAPEHVRLEADDVIRATSESVARDVRNEYPEGPTGNLRRGVTVQHNSSKFGTVGVVRSRAKHANMFERGTQRRQTGRGANRGTMPQPPADQRAIPKFIRARQRMTAALVEVLQRAGFEVDA